MPNPITTVIFCRHGESEGNVQGRFGGHGPTPLTEQGRAQARAAGELLKLGGIDRIYASDLTRASETAELIGRATGIEPVMTSALRERSVGELTGLTFDQARQQFPLAFAALVRRERDACPPGGETYEQCRARAVGFVEEALARHPGARLLFVSHHLTVVQLILHILGLNADSQIARVRFQIDNCALHRFETLDGVNWRVLALNERGHLDV